MGICPCRKSRQLVWVYERQSHATQPSFSNLVLTCLRHNCWTKTYLYQVEWGWPSQQIPRWQNWKPEWGPKYGMFWERVPRGTTAGYLWLFVVHFNIGSQACIEVFDKLGISPGEFCMTDCEHSDRISMVRKTKLQGMTRKEEKMRIASNEEKWRGKTD